jgi:hypothetical protein
MMLYAGGEQDGGGCDGDGVDHAAEAQAAYETAAAEAGDPVEEGQAERFDCDRTGKVTPHFSLFAVGLKIEAGRRHSLAEFEEFTEKYFVVEIPINNRRLLFYRIYDNTNREFRFRNDKIAVLHDKSGNYLDVVGVSWPDNQIYDTTFINDNNCILTIEFDDILPQSIIPMLNYLKWMTMGARACFSCSTIKNISLKETLLWKQTGHTQQQNTNR